jgi:DNA repair protein SbcD/Mre11
VVPLRNAQGSVAALAIAVPFLRPADVPEVADATDAYLDGIRAFYHRVTDIARQLRETRHPAAALVALGHCHLQDGDESRDSERRIVIGGVEALQIDSFSPDLVYVALGHLHRPQEFDGGRLRYSGSPIPLSFTEKDYNHRVVEVVIDDSGASSFTSLPAPKTTMLLRLPSGPATPIAEVLQGLAAAVFDATLPPEAHPFLEVRVLDDGPDPTRRRRIEEALAGKPVRLALIKLESPSRAGTSAAVVEAGAAMLPDLSALDPEEILRAAHFERYGLEPDPAMLLAFREILAGGEPAPVMEPT